jgi:hypothetical protein
MADKNTTAYDKTFVTNIIRYLSSLDDTINTAPWALGASPDLKLDASLQDLLKPGSQNWDPVKRLTSRAASFGNSANARNTAVAQELRAFTHALTEVSGIFDKTNNLADYEASKFGNEFPDIAGASV